MRISVRKVGFCVLSRAARRFLVVLIAAASISTVVGCKEREKTIVSSIDQLNAPNIIIGGEIGTVSLRTAEERFPNATINNYQTPFEAYAALEAGKIDVVAYDRPPMEYAAMQNEAFVVLPDKLGVGHIAVGAPFKKRELMKRVDDFIVQYRSDGTYEEMYERWIKTKNPEMPKIPRAEKPTETIVVGFDPQNQPMSYQGADGNPTGFDAEFVERLALFLNVDYRYEQMYYDALFPALEHEKLDLAVSNLDATPERAETMLFSKEYVDCPCGLMMRKDRYNGSLEEPATENPATENPATENPATENPATENPATENPATENPATEETPTLELEL